MTADTARRGRRTRLTPERERELYASVVELLREVGYEGLTMDAVAARARSSKATLYRQWSGKPDLVAAALREHRPVRLEEIDTGALGPDLRQAVRAIAASVDEDTELMQALAHAAERDEDLGRAFREALVAPGVAALRAMLDRAVERGELDADRRAAAFLPMLMMAPLATRPLMEGVHADAEYLVEYVDAVLLPALGVPG